MLEHRLAVVFTEINIQPLNIISARRFSPNGMPTTRVQSMKLPANKEVVLESTNGNIGELVVGLAPQRKQTVQSNVLRSSGGEEVRALQLVKITPTGILSPHSKAIFIAVFQSVGSYSGGKS